MADLPTDPTDEPGARARHGDPETSHEAARSLSRATVTRMGKRVMWAIGKVGEQGRTWAELEEDLRRLRQSISPRRVELRDKGMVTFRRDEKGEMIKRINPKSGRSQGVWFLTPLGREMLTAWLAVWNAREKK